MAVNDISLEFVEGWLHVWELHSDQVETAFSHGHRPKPKWEPRLCVFRSDKNILTSYESEEKWLSEYITDFSSGNQQTVHTRLDGGFGCFHKRWGYKIRKNPTAESGSQSPMVDSEGSSASTPTSNKALDISRKSSSASPASTPSSNKALDSSRKSSTDSSQVNVDNTRRESIPLGSTRSESMESVSTTFWLVNFFIKKGFSNSQKSTSKTDRKSSSSSLSDNDRTPLNSKHKSSHSHESVLGNAHGMQTIDLSDSNVEVKPLHSSVLGNSHCIQVATPQGNKYLSCTTAEEMDRWLARLRRTTNPQDEHIRRSDSSLKIWIVEAKNVTPKRSYFCDILLDNTLYAKTSIKTMTDMLFWGEHFDLKSLPSVEEIRVNLYREADKKKKKEKNLLVGYINLSIADLENRQLTEKWITCQSGTVGKAGKEVKSEIPIIRIKARRQTVDILPIEYYQGFIHYLRGDYKKLCQIFEPLLTVKEKEDFATSLIHILQSQGKACEFLADVVMDEISQLDDEHLTFRGNSIATKAVEAYMKLVGAKYLHSTFGDLVNQLVQSPDDCEVDPTKVATPQLLSCQQKNLDMYSNMAWVKIINSYYYFPNELREVFSSFRNRCNNHGKGDYSDTLISGCIFLRFLCPAILYPSLFNLTQEYPNERASRTLTLIAKTIQTLANFTQFGIKEDYMTFMNSFIEKEAPNMNDFLLKISSGGSSNDFMEFDGHIDLGKELSVLHALLTECIGKYLETAKDQFEELNQILKPLTIAFGDPTIGQRRLIRKSQAYDNMISEHLQVNEGSQPADTNFSTDFGDKCDPLLLSPADALTNQQNATESSNISQTLRSSNMSSKISPEKLKAFSESVNISPSKTTAQGVGEFRNILVVRPNLINIDRPNNEHLKRLISDSEYGDYIDLMSMINGDSSNQDLTHPLAFANPLFTNQQSPLGDPDIIQSIHLGNHPGIRMGHAHTIQRASDDSSTNSSEDDDIPWQVKLAKTSSPFMDPAAIEQNLSFESLQQFEQCNSFCSLNSEQSEASSFNNSSFSTCSSDFNQLASHGIISSPSPAQSFSNATFDSAFDGCSTFPRRQKMQQENVINSNVSPSAYLMKESRNVTPKEATTNPSLFNRSFTYNRQFSNPSQVNVHKPQYDQIIQQNRPDELPKREVPNRPRNIHGVRSYPDGISSAVHKIHQLRGITNHLSGLKHRDSKGKTSFNNDTIILSNLSARELQSSDKINSYKNSSKNSSQISLTSEDKTNEKTPSSITKSAGWKIALRIDKTSAKKDNKNASNSSPLENTSSTDHKIVDDLNSKRIKDSPPPSRHLLFDNISAQSDSSRPTTSSTHAQSFPCFQQEIHDNSPKSVSNLSTKTNRDNNTTQFLIKSSSLAINPKLQNPNNTQNITSKLHPNPIQLPPAFLTSNYAIVRPHTITLNQQLSPTRALSYHSSLDPNTSNPTKSNPKSVRPFTTSRSLDLGQLYHQSLETTNISDRKKTKDEISRDLSPMQTFTDGFSKVDSGYQNVCSPHRVAVINRMKTQSINDSKINSAMKKLQEQERTKLEFEKEVHGLRQQLLEAQGKLHETELRLLDNEIDTQKLTDEWQNRLVESEETLRRQRAEKDEYTDTIIHRLHLAEEELKKEHEEMLRIVQHKQEVIEVQERRIQSLDLANKKLLQALADFRDLELNDDGCNSLSNYNGVMGNGNNDIS